MSNRPKPGSRLSDAYVACAALLARDIVEAILDGWQAAEIMFGVLMRPFPAEWQDQRRNWQA